jgi:protein-tyrosine phosphatase
VIDLHSHLLPGVDDGPKTMEEALAIARAAVADGIRISVLTPHISPDFGDNNRRSLQAVFDDFASRLKLEAIPLEVRLAAEVRLSPELLDMMVDDELLFVGNVDGYRILLLEFPHEMIPVGSDKLVTMLLRHKIRPLIAHPERNQAVMEAPDRIRTFAALGCWLQLTAASLAGRLGELPQSTAFRMIDDGWNCVVATDCHNVTTRPPHLSIGRDALARRHGDAFAKVHVSDKPGKIVGFTQTAI